MITPPLWERALHQRGAISSVLVADDHVLVHERTSRLVRLNRHDGSVTWDARVGDWPRNIVRAGDVCLVRPQSPDRLDCLDLATGSPRWRIGVSKWTGHVAVIADVVLIGGWRGWSPVRALDLRTGEQLWEARPGCATVLPARLGHLALMAEAEGSRVWAIDPRTGVEVWRAGLPGTLGMIDGGPVFTPGGAGRVVARCGPGSLAVIREGSDVVGELPMNGRELPAGAVKYVGGLLFVREGRDGYRAVDPANGTLRWRVDIAQPLADGVAGTPSGFAMVTRNGTLLHLDPDGGIVRRTSLHRRVAELRGDGGSEVFLLTRGTVLAAAVDDDA